MGAYDVIANTPHMEMIDLQMLIQYIIWPLLHSCVNIRNNRLGQRCLP